jgi:hypothetical protein
MQARVQLPVGEVHLQERPLFLALEKLIAQPGPSLEEVIQQMKGLSPDELHSACALMLTFTARSSEELCSSLSALLTSSSVYCKVSGQTMQQEVYR